MEKKEDLINAKLNELMLLDGGERAFLGINLLISVMDKGSDVISFNNGEGNNIVFGTGSFADYVINHLNEMEVPREESKIVK